MSEIELERYTLSHVSKTSCRLLLDPYFSQRLMTRKNINHTITQYCYCNVTYNIIIIIDNVYYPKKCFLYRFQYFL